MDEAEKQQRIATSRFIHTMDDLQEIAATHQKVKVKDIFTVMGDEGHAILLIFLGLPYLQPIPIPGLSTVFGLLTCLVATCHYLRRPPYLPERFQNYEVSAELISKITNVAESIWKKIGKYIHCRWSFFFEHPFWRFINILVFVTNSILLALPLPIPLSNFFPNVAIMILALGLMEKDGLFVIFSYLASLVCFAYFGAIVSGTVWSLSFISN